MNWTEILFAIIFCVIGVPLALVVIHAVWGMEKDGKTL